MKGKSTYKIFAAVLCLASVYAFPRGYLPLDTGIQLFRNLTNLQHPLYMIWIL